MMAGVLPHPKANGFKLAICIPSGGNPTIGFTISLAKFLIDSNGFTYNGSSVEISCLSIVSSLVNKNRESLAELALELGTDWMLWLDDDMVFDPKAIFLLLSRNKPFVACNYPRRVQPIRSTAHRPDSINLINTTDKSEGLERAGGVGFGVALISSEVFIKTKKPWFLPLWDTKSEVYVGEDIAFCQRVIEAGFEIFVDHEASKHIGHCGEVIYTYQNVIDE